MQGSDENTINASESVKVLRRFCATKKPQIFLSQFIYVWYNGSR